MERYGSRITQEIRQQSITATIAGVVKISSGNFQNTIFSPGTTSVRTIAMPEQTDMAEYTVADNGRIGEFRETVITLAGISASALIMDTGKLENISNTLHLLKTLYPVAITAALLIGGFLTGLIILQSSKEAAIMRVLGTSKTKTRVIFTLEQSILNVTGLIIGICVTLLLKREAASAVISTLALFGAMHAIMLTASATVCAALVTSRSALELLRAKE